MGDRRDNLLAGDTSCDVEVVSHCWNYTRALAYQISSLIQNPPLHARTRLTVVWCPDDEPTAQLVEAAQQWSLPNTVMLNFVALPRERAVRRAIGRNAAAIETQAEVVWFADCDMLFGTGTFDELLRLFVGDTSLVLAFPKWVKATTHEDGDKLIAAVEMPIVQPLASPQTDCIKWYYNRAIGGVQMVAGLAARKHGYLPRTAKWQTPTQPGQAIWYRTYEDTRYRAYLGKRENVHRRGKGAKIHLPNVYRIRHSERGREVIGLRL